MLRSSHLLLLGFVVVGCAAPGMADRLSADDSDNGELKELVGGVDAKSADFPSTILIRGNCTASKIAPNKIVTAAHCVYDPETKAWGAAYQTGTI